MKKNILFIALLFYFACASKIDVQNEIRKTVSVKIPDNYEVLEGGSESVIGDYTLTYLLKLDSISMIAVINQIRSSNCFSENTPINNSSKCWYRDDKGYSFSYYDYRDNGTLSINCQVDTLQSTFYYQYSED